MSGEGDAQQRLANFPPEVREQWERERAIWQAILNHPIGQAIHRKLVDALAAAKAKTAAELASRHLPVPKDIEGWEELARIVEIPEESIGGLTPLEIYDRAMEWAKEIQIEAKRRKIVAQLAAEAEAEIAASPTPTRRRTTTKTKRNTEPRGATLKLIAALTKHHRYNDGDNLNQEPLSCDQSAELAGVRSKGTASKFFKKYFGSHRKYKKACEDHQQLVTALKSLNGEFTPFVLKSRIPLEQVTDDNE